ncbi:hypothetical protein EDEG_03605 [Edhazardia aedis USNM 41457]|uniref:Uncharacterized protein n=1 Tax=Edhazardia aedis (strain USNM 41457) TaxID=1003232 RepID=J9D251_EDHAE|nr:hypothetical protein EDEG_03605 [Edhazardia aedis USNM 41457]|eukprot:EJW01931.1 hypothetical protein EDEG_03605 [Edhazardia aedis USNM 41457]
MDKFKLDPTYRAQSNIKTEMHVYMIYKLKNILWIIAFEIIEFKYQIFNKYENPIINHNFFTKLQSDINVHICADLYMKKQKFPTKDYFKLFCGLQYIFNRIFMCLAKNYQLDEITTQTGHDFFFNMIQEMYDLKSNPMSALETCSVFTNKTISDVAVLNLTIINVMEKHLLMFFEFLKTMEAHKK